MKENSERTDEQTERLELNVLDAVDEPLVLLDSGLTPVYINSAAATLLGLSNRHCQPPSSPLALALSEFVKPIKLRNSRLRRSDQPPHVQEVRLPDALGIRRTFYACLKEIPGCSLSKAAYVISLWPIEQLKPLAAALEQARRVRRTFVYLAAHPEHSVGLQSAQPKRQLFDGDFDDTPVDGGSTDLLPALTQVIGLIDLLVDSSLTIRIDCRYSMLLAVAQPYFLRIFSHLLLEAADFAGPGSQIKLRAVADPRKQRLCRGRELRDQRLEIVIVAQRGPGSARRAHPLVDQLKRLSGAAQYRVTVADEEPMMLKLRNGEDAYSTLLGKTGPLQGLDNKSSLAFEAFSENLRIATGLAARCGIELQLRRLKGGILAIYVQLRLAAGVAKT